MSQDELDRINKAIRHEQSLADKFGPKRGYSGRARIQSLLEEKAKLPPEVLWQEVVDKFIKAIKTMHQFPDVAVNQEDVEKYRDELRHHQMSDNEIGAVVVSAETDIIELVWDNTFNKLKQQLRAYQSQQQSTHTPLQVNVQDVVDVVSNAPQNIADTIKRAIEIKIEVSAIQTVINEMLILSDDKKKEKLDQLAEQVSSYVSAINFRASLDPSITVPDDLVQHIAEWESEVTALSSGNPQRVIVRIRQELERYGISQEEINTAIRIGQDKASDS